MSEDTILTDVDEQEEQKTDEPEVILSPRDEITKAIQEKKRASRQEEESASKPVAEEVTEEVVQDGAEEELAEEKPEMVTIKVGGVEKEVPKEEAVQQGIRTLQKESAAAERLRQAALRERELDQREEKLRKILDSQKPKKDLRDLKELKDKFSKALTDDEDAAAELFANSQRELGEVRQQMNELSKTVSKNNSYVKKKQRAEGGKLKRLFVEKYPHLAKRASVWNEVNDASGQLLVDEPDLSPEDNVLSAAKIVDDSYKADFGGNNESVDNSIREKKERMVTQPRTASARQPAKKEVKPPTTKEVIANMKKQRPPF